MKQSLGRRLAELPADENGATVEWLLVAGVAVMLAHVINIAAAVIIQYVFARSAIVIALPFG
jgi:hypothetical protein